MMGPYRKLVKCLLIKMSGIKTNQQGSLRVQGDPSAPVDSLPLGLGSLDTSLPWTPVTSMAAVQLHRKRHQKLFIPALH